MTLFAVGLLVGVALAVFVYHFHVLRQFRLWGHDWRARAISAEQEVENWKLWAKTKGEVSPFAS